MKKNTNSETCHSRVCPYAPAFTGEDSQWK